MRSSFGRRRKPGRSGVRVHVCVAVWMATFAAGCESGDPPSRISFVVARDIAKSKDWPFASDLAIHDCPVREDLAPIAYRNPLGAHGEFWTDPTSRLEIAFDPHALLVTQHPHAQDLFVVRARFSESEQRRLAEYRRRYDACRLLVWLDDRPVWVATNRSDWSEEIPIGVFEGGDPAYSALMDGEWEIQVTPWPALEAAWNATRASEEGALRMLRCDVGFRDEFEKENPGALALLADRLASIDCSSGPPR